MTDFVLVAGLLSVLFAATVQLGLAVHVRNTATWCAAEGARVAARAEGALDAGVQRARDLVTQSLNASYAEHITARRTVVAGVRVVEVHVQAPLPVLGLLGPTDVLSVTGRAFAEDQE